MPMSPLEAMTLLIASADDRIRLTRNLHGGKEENIPPTSLRDYNNHKEAIEVSNQILNAALPMARFRVFVQVHLSHGKKYHYTICGVTLDDIRFALKGLLVARYEVHVTLWEQRATSAEMICGYQGPSKIPRYRSWLNDLEQYLGTPVQGMN